MQILRVFQFGMITYSARVLHEYLFLLPVALETASQKAHAQMCMCLLYLYVRVAGVENLSQNGSADNNKQMNL